MKKHSIIGILLSISLLTIVSCSSGDKENADGTSADVAEATGDANNQALSESGEPMQDPALSADGGSLAEGEKPADDNFKSQTAPADEFAEGGAPQDIPPADPLAEKAPTDPNAPPADPNAVAATETPPAAPESVPAPEVAQNDMNATPPSDQSTGDLFGSAATTAAPDAGAAAPSEEKPKKVGLAHIKTKPFKRGGLLLNTVYISREGDTLDSISEKLFGDNKVKMLKKANPALKASVKTGDKVYFNSPSRPEDNEKMMTVYEDQGLPPSTYVTKEGDTLKSLAMEWYGSEGSYKEIYALNQNLTSTKELPSETEIVYWPATAQVVAYNAKKEEPVAQAPPPPPMPESPAPAAANTMPMPPPAAPNPAMAQNNVMPPPPPPADFNAPPLPPPPTMMKKKSSAPELDKDAIFMIGGIAALLICGGALIAIRKKGGRRNQGVTQI